MEFKYHKIRDIKFLFRNCSSLSSLPCISKWNIDKMIYYSSIIEGCRLLEANLEVKDKIKRNIFNCFRNFIRKICSFLKIGYVIYSILIFIAILCLVNFPIYNSFNLNKAYFSSNNPLEFFGLRKSINSTFITNYYKNTSLFHQIV